MMTYAFDLAATINESAKRSAMPVVEAYQFPTDNVSECVAMINRDMLLEAVDMREFEVYGSEMIAEAAMACDSERVAALNEALGATLSNKLAAFIAKIKQKIMGLAAKIQQALGNWREAGNKWLAATEGRWTNIANNPNAQPVAVTAFPWVDGSGVQKVTDLVNKFPTISKSFDDKVNEIITFEGKLKASDIGAYTEKNNPTGQKVKFEGKDTQGYNIQNAGQVAAGIQNAQENRGLLGGQGRKADAAAGSIAQNSETHKEGGIFGLFAKEVTGTVDKFQQEWPSIVSSLIGVQGSTPEEYGSALSTNIKGGQQPTTVNIDKNVATTIRSQLQALVAGNTISADNITKVYNDCQGVLAKAEQSLNDISAKNPDNEVWSVMNRYYMTIIKAYTELTGVVSNACTSVLKDMSKDMIGALNAFMSQKSNAAVSSVAPAQPPVAQAAPAQPTQAPAPAPAPTG